MSMRIACGVMALLASVLAVAPETAARGQGPTERGAIDGVVSDTNLVSLSDATASILGSAVHVSTGANGRFRILGLAPGQYILVIHRLGYVPTSTAVVVPERDTLRLSFLMRPIATALDTVSIIATHIGARMMEFEARRKSGFGHFMTRGEIEDRNAVFIADLLRPIVGVQISEKRTFVQVAYNTRSGCPFQIYVDGLTRTPPVNLWDLPSPKELAGIEVYSGAATIPLQYKNTAGSFCGTILIWTRDGS